MAARRKATLRRVKGGAVREYYGHYGWYWNYWYSHKEFRDGKVAVAMTSLWMNHDNVIAYTMRAACPPEPRRRRACPAVAPKQRRRETPGSHVILPAAVFNTYHPQIGKDPAKCRLRVEG